MEVGDTEPPNLIEDVLRIVFGQLPTEDRRPLALVSKDVRALDLDVGKRQFTAITLGFTRKLEHISAETPSGTFKLESSPPQASIFMESATFLENFFKDASCAQLVFYVGRKCDRGTVRTILPILETLKFKSFTIEFECSHCFESSEFLLELIQFVREGATASGVEEFGLHWNQRWQTNVCAVQEALLQLPKFSSILIQDTVHSRLKGPSRFLLDGPTMAHLILTCDTARFEISSCNTDILLTCFEIVCRSEVLKRVARVHSREDIDLDELRVLATAKGYTVEEDDASLSVKDSTGKRELYAEISEVENVQISVMIQIDFDFVA